MNHSSVLHPLGLMACLAFAHVLWGAEPVYMANYANPSDFANLAERGINTVLVELEVDGTNWAATYDRAIETKLRMIPIIWGDDQSVWAWNNAAKEWELNSKKYPKSVGAKFLKFLNDHPQYLAQTFAIYSFHEPLADLKKTGPKRLKKFYQQITEVEFAGQDVRVYGEDVTMGWNGSDDCLTGVLDYESHNVYPFCRSREGKYRPFNAKNNSYDRGTNDLDEVLKKEVAVLDARLERYANAKPAATGRRPNPILLIQTFESKQEKDLWNRMPSAMEMETLAGHLVAERGDKVAGLAWYPFRNPSTNYLQTLSTNRFDGTGQDRWAVIDAIGARLLKR